MPVSIGTVVLLHGISRSSRIMLRLEKALTDEGYLVRNLDYPSVTYSLETLAELVVRDIQSDMMNEGQPLHFVGHSMGGILIRLILRDHRPNNLGRVVMLATPNTGSPVADFMLRFRYYRRSFGPAGQQIGTDLNAIHHSLPSAENYECGVIAGNRSKDPWFSWFLFRGPNDGKVSVENTKLDGMKDFTVLPISHSALPKNSKVIKLVQRFLKSGHF